jgi:enoyl-CoA hydratase/carnithine racemase
VSAAGLVVRREGPVLHLVLSRPERRNALDRPTLEAIEGACRSPGTARAVVIAGEGASFCAGADVAELAEPGARADRVADTLRLHRALLAARHCPVPTVAAVQGHALGAGCALAACADVVVASPDARFGLPEVRVGVAPAVVVGFIAERVGRGPLGRLALLGSTLNAEEAMACGLVDHVAHVLTEGVERVLTSVLEVAPGAAVATKRLLDFPMGPIREALVMAELRDGPEAAEGLAALTERRPPAWAGGDDPGPAASRSAE